MCAPALPEVLTHCWRNRLPGRVGSCPGLGGVVNGAADTVMYAAGEMI
jgi:hypothetical protein